MLKPCPFCGCEAVLVNEFFDDYLVMCSNSGCAVEGPLKATSDEAETAWNTRPAAAVDELIEALDKLVILQRHYADILNQYDGGNRKGFASADEWLDRLRALKAKDAAARAALTGEEE